MKPAVGKLAPSSVAVDQSIQQRSGGIDREYAAELGEILKAGGRYRDRPVAFRLPDGSYLLAGGFHRHLGAELAGKEIEYEIRVGTRRDALEYALSDNADHGRPRSNEDKRKAVETALADPEWSKLSDREIDRLCGISIGMTSRIKKEKTGAAPDAAKSAAAKKGNEVKHNKGAGGPHPGGDREESKEDAGQGGGPVPGTTAGGPAKPEGRADHPKAATPQGPLKDVPRDRLGRQLPRHLVAIFENGEVIRKAAQQARSALAQARNADRLAGVGGFLHRHPGIGPALQDGADSLLRQAPYIVCPVCGGEGDAGDCPTCSGLGWIAFDAYNRLHPTMKEEAARWRPADGWEPDGLEPPAGPDPVFVPAGAGLDALGNRIPNSLRDVFADQYLAEAAAALRRYAEGLKSASSWAVWLKPVWSEVRAIADQVEGARAYAVHKACGGQGCQGCLTGGYLPAWQRDELQQQVTKKR